MSKADQFRQYAEEDVRWTQTIAGCEGQDIRNWKPEER
jgi:hypothetical protein